MRIGFEDQTGHVFEGSSIPQFAVWPPTLLSQAKLIESPKSLHTYMPCQALLSRPGHGLGALLVIGHWASA